MQKRIPIAVGGGALAVILVSQYVDLGVGLINGNRADAPVDDQVTDARNDYPTFSMDDVDNGSIESTGAETISMPPDVVDVRIDGEEYWVVVDAAQPQQRVRMTLDEVISQVGNVPGEASGIKVRITRTPDAIALAEVALMSQLLQAGIDEDQIDSRRRLVE